MNIDPERLSPWPHHIIHPILLLTTPPENPLSSALRSSLDFRLTLILEAGIQVNIFEGTRGTLLSAVNTA